MEPGRAEQSPGGGPGDDRVLDPARTGSPAVLGRLTRRIGMRELADEIGCDASNVTQIIRRLEARDLVRRRPHPHDRRSRHIVRTADGTALYAAFEESFAFARSAIANLDAREQDQLATLLRKALNGEQPPSTSR
ncbi:MarR family winged helix-turn-helix transcriptional regulator [Nonomuraea sp. MCN248]|uniref:MarR family winged helix-turn-helix transcriptional regulator n=1 Tax=Nonomuraea corallina TaxID=2989783 RepID=A0ABT4S7D5_9ACTN|nr:MarR family winged helix-turn-helix transcriptional regulator [Nonomuraea corallina]MDA0632973.1 MarR family winged helix-turn-helix transcriptional regulator [Nonomuraea corallina]